MVSAPSTQVLLVANRTAVTARLLKAVALAVLVVSVCGSQAAFGAFPGQNGLIAVAGQGFHLTCPRYWNIHVVRPDGTGLRPLTRTGRCSRLDRWSPDWTADGKRLAFADFDYLGVMSADATDVHRLISPFLPEAYFQLRNPLSISPDGQRLAFDDQGGQTYVEPLDGSGLYNLAPGTSPRWSPDGRVIALADPGGRLVLHDASTGQQIMKRRFARREVTSIDWSPDGRRLLLVMFGGAWSLATVSFDDPASALERIRLPLRFRAAHWFVGGPAVWSPDGRRIAFVAYRFVRYEVLRASAWVMRADGRHLKRLLMGGLTDTEGLPENVSWQPIVQGPG
jgi:hypothetical protein